jgi:hypothetical protein
MLDTVSSVARIHIHAISADIPHLLALQNSLEPFAVGYDDGRLNGYRTTLQIAHNILALSFGDKETRTLIWDWTTSELLLVRQILREFQPTILTIHKRRRTPLYLLTIHFKPAWVREVSSIPHTFYPPVQITRDQSGCTNSSDLFQLTTPQPSTLLHFTFLH